MKNLTFKVIFIISMSLLASCAHIPPDRYNTQKGAAIGAGAGALLGQATGRNTEGTLIGMAAGTILGALVGNSVDQDYQAARDAEYEHTHILTPSNKSASVKAGPGPGNRQKNCQTVTKRNWEDGKLVSETLEEICEDPVSEVILERPYYVYPAYPRVYFRSGYSARPRYGYRHRRHAHRPYGLGWRGRHYR